jgi:toxin ParE1/3/4
MPYLVSTSAQAERDIEGIFSFIQADTSDRAADWFNGLLATIRTLGEMPQRCPPIPEDPEFRHLLYGKKPHIYRVIFGIDEAARVVTVFSVRHGARSAFRASTRR